MPLADTASAQVEAALTTLGDLAKASTTKAIALAVMVVGIGLLRLADAISSKTKATVTAASGLREDTPS